MVEVAKAHSEPLFGIYLHCISKGTHGGSKEALLSLEFKRTLEEFHRRKQSYRFCGLLKTDLFWNLFSEKGSELFGSQTPSTQNQRL